MLLFVITFLIISAAAKRFPECGYKQCPSPRVGSLNVHLVPHSHMDAGWAKTFDQYYHGTNANVSVANVQLIYRSVLTELLANKERRFTFSETSYFWRWWKYQTLERRASFKSLVADGRISFAGGGWVQTDESTVDYLQILDQYTWGLRLINDTVGPCGTPRAGWQTDAYGHTREHAALLAQMGFDGLFIDSVTIDRMSDVMTHALYDTRAPEGFCFDCACAAEPVVVDTDTTAFNADQRAKEFIRHVEALAKLYNHDNILMPMGGDFSYQNAASWFNNMDNLIRFVKSHRGNMSDVNIFYSSPACYLKSIYLHGRKDRRIHAENGDHVPYGMDNETYWTGFYSSRPGLKYLARRAHVFLQVAKQLSVLSNTPDSNELYVLRHAVSLVTHHDGITGTSSQLVVNDFVKTLVQLIEFSSRKISQFLSKLTPTWENKRQPRDNLQLTPTWENRRQPWENLQLTPTWENRRQPRENLQLTPTWENRRQPRNSLKFFTCHHLNLSQCAHMDAEDTLLLLVYNPLSFRTHHHVRIPVTSLHYTIRDFNDDEVESQVLPLPESIASLPGRNSSARHEMYFEAENIPPLGFTAYYVTAFKDQMDDSSYVNRKKQKLDDGQEVNPTISNEFLRVAVDQSTGLLESIQHADGIKIMINQNFYYYPQVQQDLQSGSYSFRPGTKRPLAVSESVEYQTIKSQLVKEIRQTFSEWVSQTIRLYRGEEFVELEWVVGPVPLGLDRGKEVVTIFRTNISNDGTFYTDSNSRQMMKRTCQNDTRREQEKSVSACYYPITSRICLQSVNTSAGLCVLTDRTQGGTSYSEGNIELMIHRRLMTSDGIGLDEPLNEEEFGSGAVVRGRHRIFLGSCKQEVGGQSLFERASLMSRKWMMEPWLFFTSGEKMSRRRWRNVRNKRYSGLQLNGLPHHIHVLTLEPWRGGSVLLRLENLLEKSRANQKNDKNSLSDITVNLREIFLHHRVKTVKETTLAANQWLDEARQMDWSSRYLYDDRLQEELDYNNDNPFEDRRQSEEFTRNTEQRRRNKQRRNYPYHTRYPRSSGGNENIKDTERNINHNDTSNEATERGSVAYIDENDYITLDNISNYKRKDHVVLKEVEKLKGYNFKIKEEDNCNATNVTETNERKSNENDSYADDDVTESMYEMYYKTRPGQRSSQEFKQSDIKRNKENVNDNNVIYVPIEKINYEIKETKSRMNNVQTLVDESKDDISDKDNDESDEENSDEIEDRILKKRSLTYQPEHSSELPEQDDYLFTLRPTQIRTFVVWFEESKYNSPRNQ